MVLLKNNNSLLPLDSNTIKSIAIIGPRAKFWQFNAHGSPGLTPTVQVNAYDGIVQRLAGNKNIRISYDAGRDYNGGEPIPVADLTTPSGEHGFSGSYFSNETLDGAPVLTRTDQSIDFDWNNDTRPKGIGREHYSIRWNASLTAPSTGTYTFNVHVDDGCRLWIGDTLVVDDWNVGGGREDSGTITLNVGQIYPLKLEYFQDGGDASVSLSWKTPTYVYAPYKAAAEIASQSDVAIVLVGSEPEGEGSDRKSMDLPDNQDALIQAVSKANPHTVVVLDNGAPVLVNSWLDGVPAVLGAGFSGELGGKALAAILFGDENPSGKLVDTYGVRREDYPDYGNFPGVRNVVRYTEGIYVGYRAFDKRNITPEFPFGYGLSYTTFSYSKIKLQKPAWNPSGAFLVTADITNAGHRKGAEVAQLYIEPQSPQIDRPIRELKGFDRVELAPGQTKTVTFPLTPRDFAYCDVPGKQWRADKGEYTIEVGASSRNLLLKALLTLTQTWTEAIPGIGAVDPSLPKPSLATGMTGSASSDTNSNVAQYAFDNDPNTRWESRYSDPQWLAVDLKTPTSISRVRINWETAFSDKFQLQVSNDNANWNIVYSTENGPGGIQTITFPGPVTARYVRLFMIHRATQFGDSIWSFDVYAK
jgi:beta-glucosidase